MSEVKFNYVGWSVMFIVVIGFVCMWDVIIEI